MVFKNLSVIMFINCVRLDSTIILLQVGRPTLSQHRKTLLYWKGKYLGQNVKNRQVFWSNGLIRTKTRKQLWVGREHKRRCLVINSLPAFYYEKPKAAAAGDDHKQHDDSRTPGDCGVWHVARKGHSFEIQWVRGWSAQLWKVSHRVSGPWDIGNENAIKVRVWWGKCSWDYWNRIGNILRCHEKKYLLAHKQTLIYNKN